MNLHRTPQLHDGSSRTECKPRLNRLFTLLFVCLLSMTAGQGYAQDSTSEELARYRTAANQGEAWAQYNLGLCYYNGEGVARDYAEAVRWWRKAAEQGHAAAQCLLGICYEIGEGVTKDYAEAAKWYRKAAEQGFAEAQCLLGICYETGNGVTQDYVEAARWYHKAAEQGLADAQSRLGYCYNRGVGVEQDYTEAAQWYRKAADQGEAWAQYNLGVCYKKGEGVAQDYAEAARWYRKAAEQGLAAAQYNLGVCYKKGEGVAKNYTEAARWYRMAAEQGHEFAGIFLENVLSKITDTETDDETVAEETAEEMVSAAPEDTEGEEAKGEKRDEAPSQPKQITPASVEPTGIIYGHEYVDLGLSVKWATCNVGASSPSDCGDYFAWGRTKPSPSCVDVNHTTRYNKSKHCIAGKESSDVARAKWGGSWYIPTMEDFQELVDKCTWTLASLNGQVGYCVTGPNGNSLFLPLAGYEYCYEGRDGYYWSSTPGSVSKEDAYCLELDNNSYIINVRWRLLGYSIRPVTE